MYFYFGNFYANAIVFVNKHMYISEDILWCLILINTKKDMPKRETVLLGQVSVDNFTAPCDIQTNFVYI